MPKMNGDENLRPQDADDGIPVTVETEEAPRAMPAMASAAMPPLLFMLAIYAADVVGRACGADASVMRAFVRLAATAVLALAYRRGRLRETVLLRCRAADGVRAVLIGAFMQVSLACIVSLFAGGGDIAVGVRLDLSDAAVIASMAVSVLLTPLCEEAIFRALAYTRLRACTSSWVAAVVSSLLFALVHPSVTSAAAAFIAGMVLAFLYERSASLAVCVIAHASFNALSYFIGFAPGVSLPVRIAAVAVSAAMVVLASAGIKKAN